jgi:hypothetical protein
VPRAFPKGAKSSLLAQSLPLFMALVDIMIDQIGTARKIVEDVGN